MAIRRLYALFLFGTVATSHAFLHKKGQRKHVFQRERTNEETSVAFVAGLEFANVPNVPLPEGTHLPTVLWGIETNGQPAYEKIVEAQLATWAKDLPRQDLIIVGGKFDDSVVADNSWSTHVMPNICADDRWHLNCKEAVLLYRAVERAEATGADWLMVGQEDKYLWTDAVQRSLAHLDASKPQVKGSFGCGQGWKYHEESKNGTVPRPSGWIEPQVACQGVYEQGGLCGGPTYYVSRAALNLLKKKDQTSKEFVAEYLASARGDPGASDLFSSCLFYSRGIPQSKFYDNFGIAVPSQDRLSDVQNMRQGMGGRLLAAHLSGNKAKIPDLIYNLAKM